MSPFMKRVFITGFISNFFIRFRLLFLLGTVFCIVGIWVGWCLKAGLTLLFVDATVSLIDQILIYRGSRNSTNPEFLELWNAANSPNGQEEFRKVMDAKITNAKNNDPEDE